MFFETLNYNSDEGTDSDENLLNLDADDDIYEKEVEQPLLKENSENKVTTDRQSFVLNDCVNIEEEIKLYAVFVISFDTKLGNIIEWQVSEDNINFTNIEFKAMPSGLHLMKDDLM